MFCYIQQLQAKYPSIHPSSVHIICTPLNPLQGRGGLEKLNIWTTQCDITVINTTHNYSNTEQNYTEDLTGFHQLNRSF